MHPRIMIIYVGGDDPSKNTALKMIRMGLAFRINPRNIHGKPVVLDPYSPEYLGSWVHGLISRYGLIVYDTSWKKLRPGMIRRIRGAHYKLPPLLPGNPINYAKPCILSSIEAVAATLYITGYVEAYEKLLGLYKWMKTFHILNQQLLRDYQEAKTPEKLLETIRDYWGEKPPC